MKEEAEQWQEKADESAAKVKALEQDLLEKENEIKALTTRNQALEETQETLEGELEQHKKIAGDATHLETSNENALKKNAALEEELEASDKTLKETTAKLREMDVKVETLENKVASLEAEKEDLETKLEAVEEKYTKANAELEEITKELEGL